MTVVLVFVGGVALASAAAAFLVAVLRPHLDRLLCEVCGTEARAGFWAVMSVLTIGLVTFLAATVAFYPDGDPGGRELFFGLVAQLRTGLGGLLISTLVVAWILVGSIRKFERRALPPAR